METLSAHRLGASGGELLGGTRKEPPEGPGQRADSVKDKKEHLLWNPSGMNYILPLRRF